MITKAASFDMPVTSNAQVSTGRSTKGLVRHFVAFQYVSEAAQREVDARFLELYEKCMRNGKRYILAIDRGSPNSCEGLDQNFVDGFLVTFASVEDRNYYVGQCKAGEPYPAEFDQVHDDFKKFAGDNRVTKAFVFDFSVEEERPSEGS